MSDTTMTQLDHITTAISLTLAAHVAAMRAERMERAGDYGALDAARDAVRSAIADARRACTEAGDMALADVPHGTLAQTPEQIDAAAAALALAEWLDRAADRAARVATRTYLRATR